MGTGAHGDVETVEVAELVRATRVYLALLSASGRDLRGAVRELPLAGAGAGEPGRRRLRAAPARRGRDRGHGRTRGHPARHLRRALGRLEPARERAAGSGIGEGDRVGIALPQRPETAVAHIAVYKLGAIAVPLSTRFGPDAMAVRIGDADPAVVLADRELEGVRTIDVDRELPALLAAASDRFEPVATAADTPALIVYTSGTTGPPKGALLAHRVLHGHLPGFELSHDFFPQPDDLIWTPADWAWMGGLFDVLMPGLYHGRPVLAFQTTKFDPELSSI